MSWEQRMADRARARRVAPGGSPGYYRPASQYEAWVAFCEQRGGWPALTELGFRELVRGAFVHGYWWIHGNATHDPETDRIAGVFSVALTDEPDPEAKKHAGETVCPICRDFEPEDWKMP